MPNSRITASTSQVDTPLMYTSGGCSILADQLDIAVRLQPLDAAFRTPAVLTPTEN